MGPPKRRGNRNGNSPPEAYLGAVVDEPALSDAEWDGLSQRCGIEISGPTRELIDRALWWCKWQKLSASVIPRPAEVRRRLRDFVRGADLCLGALGYLEAAGIASVADRPPVTTPPRSGPGVSTWLALRNAASNEKWDNGYWTARAMNRLPDADDALEALHALAYTANRAINEWEADKGGRASSGDKHFVGSLLSILSEAGIDVSYSQDRSVEEGEVMGGASWGVLLEIWALRPEAFVANEHSTLGKYYRLGHAKLSERT